MTETTKVVLVDNYDSFTWNLYEYLCREGAEVEVFRNDAITIDEIERRAPQVIVISPGPGHPLSDSGISRDVIRHFAGKVPVVGICMGEQCIFSVFGGDVSYAGEIVHGKTSTISHDGKGLFKNVPQGVAVTRYHSLAGTISSLPDCLEITATTESGVIMGVRHKEYIVEGLQFHPESILTEEGRLMVRNILELSKGQSKIDEAKQKQVSSESVKGKSILDTIFDYSKQQLELQKAIPGKTPRDMQNLYDLGLAPPIIDLHSRLSKNSPALLAEIKRASPSKGPIDLQVNVPAQALQYAEAGASAISVLTEPKWFKGCMEDLRTVRLALDKHYTVETRPAVLRKEFIHDEYQILEARVAGADSVLLIVKMLEEIALRRLYAYAKSLGMEPLVEVNSAEEMEKAVKLGARVIGVNNRDLHTFNVDLSTTSRLVSMVPEGTVLAALSGISSNGDVRKYLADGVSTFLIGEALMKAGDTKSFVKELLASE